MKSITGKNSNMRNTLYGISIWLLVVQMMGLSSCNHPAVPAGNPVQPKVPVTTSAARIGSMAEQVELNATSVFFDEAQIKSPVAGYVDQVNVNPGDHVTRNEELLMIRTKESAAIMNDSANPLIFSGKIKVRSSINGIILSVDHPEGDYVQEGDLLCRIAVPNSLVFIMEVPYEWTRYIKLHSICTITLPDGSSIQASISSRLPSVTQNTQTQRYILQPLKPQNLPQNLIARIRISKRINPEAIILPKSCLLTDEVMKTFWVMKLLNDSVAVKVLVKPGISTSEEIEIISPVFTGTDRFLTSGNYGLGDTASISILQGK